MLIGEPYWRQLPGNGRDSQARRRQLAVTDFLTLPGLVSAFR